MLIFCWQYLGCFPGSSAVFVAHLINFSTLFPCNVILRTSVGGEQHLGCLQFLLALGSLHCPLLIGSFLETFLKCKCDIYSLGNNSLVTICCHCLVIFWPELPQLYFTICFVSNWTTSPWVFSFWMVDFCFREFSSAISGLVHCTHLSWWFSFSPWPTTQGQLRINYIDSYPHRVKVQMPKYK